jgi:hypothetical protein
MNWERTAFTFMSSFPTSLLKRVRVKQTQREQPPLRAEIFSVERLEQYAQTLAAEHETVIRKGRAQLLPRLEDNARVLEASYKVLV